MIAVPSPPAAALDGLTVLERGWLSSNNIVIHPAPGEDAAVLVDASHVAHAEQTVALLRHVLGGTRLARVYNTHLHSDHCGGNATLQRVFGAEVIVPPGLAQAVRDWDAMALSHDASGQRSERFTIAGTLAPGEHFVAGARRWEAHAAPGHDPHSLILHDAANGVLISADALWEQGFGVVFPEIDGVPGFDDVARTLDLIESLGARVVIPGHGAPFTDLAGALARARSRLAGFRAQPERHARHAVKVLVKYHVMEEGALPLEGLLHWAAETPLLRALWHRFGVDDEPSGLRWCERFVHELVKGGALALDGGMVRDA